MLGPLRPRAYLQAVTNNTRTGESSFCAAGAAYLAEERCTCGVPMDRQALPGPLRLVSTRWEFWARAQSRLDRAR
jgi:hypothetical protein